MRVTYLRILTSCIQTSFDQGGFALMWHSKYTSSPSLMSSGLNVDPRFNDTIGGSANITSEAL
jgi:hypothetical protein